MSKGTTAWKAGSASWDADGGPRNRRGSEPAHQTMSDVSGHDGGDQNGHDAKPHHKNSEQAEQDSGRDRSEGGDEHRHGERPRNAQSDTTESMPHRQILARLYGEIARRTGYFHDTTIRPGPTAQPLAVNRRSYARYRAISRLVTPPGWRDHERSGHISDGPPGSAR